MSARDDIGRLFLEPPGRFVAARDALAKELRSAGEKERAAEVKKLRRPTAAAWAVDQLARRRPDDVGRLLDAGAALRSAHEAALSGSGSAADLRAAAEAEREAVEELTGDARTLLEEADLAAEPTVERVRATLHGAASDEDLREQIRAGRLSHDRAAVGLGASGAVEVAEAPAPRDRSKKSGAGARNAAAKERERREAKRAEQEERRRRDAARKAERDVTAAERRLAKAREEEEAAGRRTEEVRAEAERAERRLEEARDQVADLEEALAEARRRAEDLG